MSFCIDISERKATEEKKNLKERMEYLSNIASGFAHDFNNLLAVIIGSISLLELTTENLSEKQKEYLKRINEGAADAEMVVNQFTSLTTGNYVKKQNTDLFDILLHVLKKNIISEHIEKNILLEKNQFRADVNASQLEVAVSNIIKNSVEAITDISRKGMLTISAERTTKNEKKYIHLIFSDNGRGMTDEVRRKAFDPLFSTKEMGSIKAQGLGLTTVYNIIVEKHQGIVELVSEVDSGTSVHIFLPAATDIS